MQSFITINEINVNNNFKNEKIKSIFDIKDNKIVFKKEHKLFYDEIEKWNIGVIIGNSGSGKTSLAKQIAERESIKVIEKNIWNDDSIINNFNGAINEILDFLSSIGLNTQPSYLKPYSVLSNGEKMRVDVARSIFENDYIIIDEFTSVVDRDIAKIICMCVKKLIVKKQKKVIFVSCHKDFLEWLEPDWFYDIDKKEFIKDLLWQRPPLQFFIAKGEKKDWEYFKQYHYLSSKFNANNMIYILYDEYYNKIGICAFIHFPHNKIKLIKVHRLVILPDYQGIGLGNKMLSECCKQVRLLHKDRKISISTSLLRFAKSIEKNKDFICFFQGASEKNNGMSFLNFSKRDAKVSFYYKH